MGVLHPHLHPCPRLVPFLLTLFRYHSKYPHAVRAPHPYQPQTQTRFFHDEGRYIDLGSADNDLQGLPASAASYRVARAIIMQRFSQFILAVSKICSMRKFSTITVDPWILPALPALRALRALQGCWPPARQSFFMILPSSDRSNLPVVSPDPSRVQSPGRLEHSTSWVTQSMVNELDGVANDVPPSPLRIFGIVSSPNISSVSALLHLRRQLCHLPSDD